MLLKFLSDVGSCIRQGDVKNVDDERAKELITQGRAEPFEVKPSETKVSDTEKPKKTKIFNGDK